MEVVQREVAEQEIDKWLDSKKIFKSDRENNQSQIDTLVDAIVNGVLSVDSEGNFVHKLMFPTEGDKSITELKYKKRLQERDTRRPLKGVSPTDIEGRMTAYIQALTDETSGIIGALDTYDARIAKSIVVFFL
jgi:hypothetical protein